MKTKLLIVDDLRENILALSRLIEADDIEIHTALTPDEALNLVLDHDFGLALLDVNMPTMTGFELARLVRGMAKTKDMPIIFVTAHTAESKLIFEGYESGAVDVLFKPLDPHMVRSKVRVFVRLDQQSRQLAAQVGAMAQLKEEADAANLAKSRFLANMSHEIRTPLSAVLGFADVLSQENLGEGERKESLSSIQRNGKLLLRIIDDILDLSRIEAQRLELEKTPFDLDELLTDIESTLTNKASAKGVELKLERKETAHGRFTTDPLRLKQILLNVIGNAIKFTDRGTVKVSVETQVLPRLASQTPLAELRFSIEDTGIGLSQEEAQRLFVPFAQADITTRKRYGGTGLGLAISKQLARALGGDIKLIETLPGQGTKFLLTIRAPKEETAAPPQQKPAETASGRPAISAPALKGKKILVVDDVTDNRTLIDRYLSPVGVKIEQASGGMEAVELATRKLAEESWDLILMDIQMPTMDGYETTARLREMGFKNPIVALTAHAMKDELERCIRAGCDMTLTKPVAKKDLIARLSEVLA